MTKGKENTTAAPECRSGNDGEHMPRERQRGLMWADGPGQRRHPRAETFSAAGHGARAAPQAEKSASANDRASCNERGLRVEEEQAIAARNPACATTRDGQILDQHGWRHGGEGKCGSVAAAMRPEGVPSNADSQGHTHIHWAALDTQTKALQKGHTRDQSSPIRRARHGRHKPGDNRREEADQSSGEGAGGVEQPRFRVAATMCKRGPQSSIPYSRTSRTTERMMRIFAATQLRGDTSTGYQV
jgi:hypothetical protein